MARNSSKQIMGYLKIDEKHHAVITSLVAPATPAHRLLDPYAGHGEFLNGADQAWNVTPYANELDEGRFGSKQAVCCHGRSSEWAGGGVKLRTVDLDAEACTKLITGGLEQKAIELPQQNPGAG